jgi:hypothetical protein
MNQPGCTGGDDNALRMVGVLDSKCAEVIITAAQGPFHGAVGHLQYGDFRHPFPPAAVSGGQGIPLGMGESRCVGTIVGGQNGQDCAPLPMSGYGHPILDGVTGNVGTRYVDSGAFADVLPTAPNGEHPVVGFSCFLPPSPDTCLLHLEEVRVVGPRFQSDDALSWLLGVVVDGELLLEAGPDFPQSFHDKWAVRVAVGPGDPCNKCGTERLLCLRREWFKRLSIHC